MRRCSAKINKLKHISVIFFFILFSVAGKDQLEAKERNGAMWSGKYSKTSQKKERPRKQGKKQKRGGDRPVAPPEQAWSVASIILGRPGTDTITVSMLPAANMEAYIEYGQTESLLDRKTERQSLTNSEPGIVTLTGLKSNTAYSYRLRYRNSTKDSFHMGPTYRFHTQRAPGSSFTFTIQSDSHLGTDQHCDPALYARTLMNITEDRPDFHMDLGDTFRATKLRKDTPTAVEQLFRNQRNYFGLVSHSAPLFLVLGNHDYEWGWDLKNGVTSMSSRMTQARNRFYPNPVPGGIFTGNRTREDGIGQPANYYAWEWGDGLFIALDIYRHTTVNPKEVGNSWDWTLGDAQYQWLTKTLAESRKPVKCVFLHHLHGTCRGAVEWVDCYEWGGEDRKGRYVFKQHRPEWPLPVHQLLVRHGVTSVFQGHDHIFASQEKDGIAYITCPMPGDPGYNAYNQEAFRSGKTVANSGHLRVKVSENGIKVEYVRSFLPNDETGDRKNGSMGFSKVVSTAVK
ncbi:metallophosphoesterase [Candidatus Hydrogenedentota bacterium]